MDVKAELLKEHSKTQAQKVAQWAAQSTKNFEVLLDVFLHSDYRLNQRAAWPMGIVGDLNPQMLMPYLGVLINNLTRNGLHDAVKRNTVRILQNIDVPEEHLGVLADVCFKYLADPKEPVAIKAFSMSVLYNITKRHTDLKNELKTLIEEQLPNGSAGLINRGNKVLAALDKLK